MAVTAHTYTKLALSLGNKLVDFDTDVLKVMLLSAYTVGSTQDTAQFVADVTAAPATELATSGSYAAGGATLATVSVAESAHVYTVSVSVNPTWAVINGSPAYALFYDSSPGSAATNPVICYWDFGGAVSPAGGSFTLQLTGSALLTMTGS